MGGLAMDKAGNLYGTTQLGGTYDDNGNCNSGSGGCGTVFKITPQ